MGTTDMRFSSDNEFMADPSAFDGARIEVAPDTADPEAGARVQTNAGVSDDTKGEAGV